MRMLTARSVAAALVIVVVALMTGQPTIAQQDPANEFVLADRVVALVDSAPLFESDLVVAERLGRVVPEPGESRDQFRQRLLDQLIDERLRYAAVRRQGQAQINLGEIEEQVEALIERFGGAEELKRVLAEAGMDVDLLRELFARQLVVWNYVENRLGARVFVDLEEIEDYYENELTPAMEQAGAPLPPLREVREDIRQVLYEQKLTEEVDRWTAELRFKADVSTYLDRYRAEPSADEMDASP